jgi:DNA-binding response OmpR family regulator
VDVAATFRDAADHLGKRTYGAVVADIDLRSGVENETGLELARLVKNRHPKTFVVIITGRRPEDLVEKVGELEFDSYVEKPVDIGKLRTKLHRLLNMEERMHGNV